MDYRENAVGRPGAFTPEIEKEIIDVISTTPGSLKKLCKMHAHWPDERTIRERYVSNKEFSRMYIEAKRLQIHAYVEECHDMYDECAERKDPNFTGAVKLGLDLRKWCAARLLPRLYGDKTYVVDTSANKQETLDALKPESNDKEY